MKLIYILNQRLPTEKAYGIQVVQMCRAFARAGVRVELLLPTRRNQLTDEVLRYYKVPEVFTVSRVRSPDIYFPGVLDRIAFWLKMSISAVRLVATAVRHKPDVVYCREEQIAILSALVGKSVILELHNFSANRLLLYWAFRSLGVRLVCITHTLVEQMKSHSFPGDRVVVAPDGFDPAMFEELPGRADARRLAHLPEGLPIVLYAGHLYPWKGVDTLAQAAPKIDGLVIFVGGTEADIARMKSVYGHIPNIMFVGHRPHGEIPMWLRAADVLVLPNSAKEVISARYTSPLKMFEYMASGTPIVASDLPSVREVLNTENAFLVQPDDPEALAGGATEVLSGLSSRQRSTQALSRVGAFSWERRAEAILRFIAR